MIAIVWISETATLQKVFTDDIKAPIVTFADTQILCFIINKT